MIYPIKEGVSRNLYFGVGISNNGKFTATLNQYMPFDILGMILPAELTKREQGLEKVFVLIADEHAKVNRFRKRVVDEVANNTRRTIENVIDKLDMKGWEILFASDIAKDRKYQDILESIPEEYSKRGLPVPNGYITRELTDIKWFNAEKGVDIKLGWTDIECEHDEMFFDAEFEKVFGENLLTFEYVPSGRELNGKSVPPYLCSKLLERAILSKFGGLDRQQFKQSSKKLTRKYWDSITRDYERVTEKKFNKKEGLFDRMTQICEGVGL